MKKYYVYIMTNKSKTLYVGVTSNLRKRVIEHKEELIKGFTSKYKIKQLVYFEKFKSPREAILREKQLKGWIRKKKIELIELGNPDWKDLNKESL